MTSPPSPTDLPVGTADPIAADMTAQARHAAAFLKSLSHEARLMILCHLAEGEKSVSELVALLSLRQAAVSQQLARLRADRLVKTRREGKTIYYAVADGKAQRLVALLYEMFCAPGAEQENATP